MSISSHSFSPGEESQTDLKAVAQRNCFPSAGPLLILKKSLPALRNIRLWLPLTQQKKMLEEPQGRHRLRKLGTCMEMPSITRDRYP